MATEAEFSMFDVRSNMLIGYFGHALPATDHVHYVPAGSYPMSGTDWMIRESLDTTPLAGVNWLLYKRNNTPLRTAPGR